MDEFENSIHNCLAGDEELTAISTRFFNILQEEESELLIENFDDEQIFQQIEVNSFYNILCEKIKFISVAFIHQRCS